MSKPKKIKNPITAWSYSRLEVYETCPRQFKYKFIDKLPEPPAPAMARGDRMHKGLEAYVKGEVRALPIEALEKTKLTALRPVLAGMRKLKTVSTELAIALDNKWQVVADYFDKRVWLRAKLDLVIPQPEYQRITVVDHKSGRVYAKHQDQLDLYAPIALARFPEAHEIIAQMYYLDQDLIGPESVYPKRVIPKLRAKFELRAKRLFADTAFLPAPSEQNCKWCPRSIKKGGPCKEGV